MCGFAGIIDFDRGTAEQPLRLAAAHMASTVRHRGPDDSGVWIDPVAGIALGHRRLAILDLSPAGHQPMTSASGRYVIVYNGEIYNHQELRREVDSCANGSFAFRGRSDTEVMLAAFERWGVPLTLSRLNGMFAFALWDRRDRRLYLGRDRMGEKPLYYGWVGKTFLFGSELKALKAHPFFIAQINRDALALYMRHSCIPAPHSIFRGVYKLPPGTLLTLDSNADGNAKPVPYWSLEKVARDGGRAILPYPEAESLKMLESLLREAVRIRMVADVPLGVFLSGGIDSCIVAALMQTQSGRPVRTFSIGLHESDYNEAHYAAEVARYLGTDHTELYVTHDDALAVIPLLPEIYDEPFADSSQIPTLLLSRMARQQVTVALSGDGGDELFGGYNRHVWSAGIWRTLGRLPKAARRAVASVINEVSRERWDSLFQVFEPALPKRVKHRMPGYKLHKLASILPAADLESAHLALVSHWANPGSIAIGAQEPYTLLTTASDGASLSALTERMMLLDALTYLPDDILTKLDRASMAVGLEARVPLLDHRVVEFAWRIPLSMKVRNRQGKWIMRQLLNRHVPPRLIDRPKSGFGVPLNTWLRGPLRDWAEALLDERRIRSEGFFKSQPIREKWDEFLSGRGAWEYHLWDVLMFQAWLSEQRQSQAQMAASFAAVS
jgi:asparagine synthase (glutamine-hydrolysing)